MKSFLRFCLGVSQVLALLSALWAFLIIRPWIQVISVEEARARYHVPVPADWQGVLHHHGRLTDAHMAPVFADPWSFVLCVTWFLASIAYFWLTLANITLRTPKALRDLASTRR